MGNPGAKTYTDVRGRTRELDTRGWPKGTERWEDFGTGPHNQHEHQTVHNLSPVQGADDYSEHYAGKAKWHYDRFGRTPGASLAKAGLYDFRSQVAKGYPK